MEQEKRLFVASLANDGNVPTELRLFKHGVNEYTDGDRIIFDEESASMVMKRYQQRGIDLMADYEHQSLVHPPVEAPASAKKFTPEVRDGDLYAADIKWTDRAKKMIADGEYRYYSIAARVDPKTSRVVQLINFALTNNPAANHIAPLKAASMTASDMNAEMQQCADMCEQCATDCDAFDDPAMKACAEECRRCAEACRTAMSATAKSQVWVQHHTLNIPLLPNRGFEWLK